MKKIKQIIDQIQSAEKEALNPLLWQLICYSPQWPMRFHQQQLLEQAEKFSFKVFDPHFSKSDLNVNAFKWGNGKYKILLTHGWGSKAADFSEIIVALTGLDDITLITFDAPGNGSSDGSLSNLLLYAASIDEIVKLYGAPDIALGHSLGAMANAMALKRNPPKLLISLAPLIRLKENFLNTMTAVNVDPEDQHNFIKSFEDRFDMKASDFDMNKLYEFDSTLDHWVGFDEKDHIAPYPYLKEFLGNQPSIISYKFTDVGHEKIIKDPEVIKEIEKKVNSVLAA